MGYAEEIRILKMKLNAMIEENAKLKGSQKAVQSINEELRESYKDANEKADIYKDAFDNIFFKNINPNEWEEYSKTLKEKNRYAQTEDSENGKERNNKDLAKLEQDLKAKALFLNKEISYSKIYIRDKMKEKIKEIEKEKNILQEKNKELQRKIDSYKANLPDIDEKSFSQPKVGRPSTKTADIDSNPLDMANSEVSSKVEKANQNLKEKENDLKKSFFENFLSKNNHPTSSNFTSTSNNNHNNKEKSSPISPPKPVVKPSANTTTSKPSMKSTTEESKKQLNYMQKLTRLPKEEQSEIANKISKINSQFNLSEKHYQFIKAIGDTGYFQMKDIIDSDNKTFSNAYNLKNSLVEAGLVQELEEINGATGRGFKPIILSELGNMAYLLRFKKNPYESTYFKLIREQKSPAHGLKIQQLVSILIEAGYSCTQEDVKQTPSGRDTICDILARKQKTDFRIEYEEGNYSKENYLDKFSRIWEVTPYLIVIVPNEEVKSKISQYVSELVAQKFRGFDNMRKAGYQELIYTINQLKSNPSAIVNLIRQSR